MPPVFSFWLNCTSLRSSESLCLGKLLSMMVSPAFTLSSDPFFSPWLDSKFNFSSFQEKYNKCLNWSEVKLRRGRGKSPQISSSLVLRQSVSQSAQLLSCVWLWHPMDCSPPGFPVHHQLLELTLLYCCCFLSPSSFGDSFILGILKGSFTKQESSGKRGRWLNFELWKSSDRWWFPENKGGWKISL